MRLFLWFSSKVIEMYLPSTLTEILVVWLCSPRTFVALHVYLPPSLPWASLSRRIERFLFVLMLIWKSWWRGLPSLSQVTFGKGDPAILHLSLILPPWDTERYSVIPVTLGLLTETKKNNHFNQIWTPILKKNFLNCVSWVILITWGCH